MKAINQNELRLGNLIKDGNDIEQVTIDHLVCMASGRCEFEPIHLTEEWLVKLGFDFNNKDYFLSKKGFDICFEKQGGLLKCFLDSIEIDIQHVHQLQNLYWCLCGEELTIKTEQQ